MSQFTDALASINVKIIKYDPDKPRPISTNHGTYTIKKFSALLLELLGGDSVHFIDVHKACHEPKQMQAIIGEYAEEKGIRPKEKEIPPELDSLTLNCNMAAKGREDRFFLTHSDETVSRISGEFYLLAHQMGPIEAVAAARNVVPEYMPRQGAGVSEIIVDGKEQIVFNTYTPPAWTKYPRRDKLPDRLPIIFEKLVNHLFPLPEEREFFFSWLYNSLFRRSYTFLILCSAPGTGKNRLKLVMRALHGHVNTIDGKKSTISERFNSQLSESTLAWFDELHYDMEMENTMKELQNDSISIEKKGVDATRATKIHASIVISNNKPRDNYIAFDARKFAPLVITPKRLEQSMTSDEIDAITQKVEDPSREEYDVAFIAQIAKWIKKHGASRKWPNQEYHGPMFWTLAHTSMTRWQKKAAMLILESSARSARAEYDAEKGFLWSTLSDKSMKKNGDRSLHFPDHTSVKAFFEVFRDAKGRKAFKTRQVPDNIMGDFWVKPLFKKMTIMTEASVVEQRGRNEKASKEIYDL